VISKSGT